MRETLRDKVLFTYFLHTGQFVSGESKVVLHLIHPDKKEPKKDGSILTLCYPVRGIKSTPVTKDSMLNQYHRICRRCLLFRKRLIESQNEKSTSCISPTDISLPDEHKAFAVTDRIGFPPRFTRLSAIAKLPTKLSK